MLNKDTPIGKNVKRLICERAAQLQTDAAKSKYGVCGVGEVAMLLIDEGPDGLKSKMKDAFDWVAQALEAVRNSVGGEQWPTDEDVAGEILRRIEEKRSHQKAAG